MAFLSGAVWSSRIWWSRRVRRVAACSTWSVPILDNVFLVFVFEAPVGVAAEVIFILFKILNLVQICILRNLNMVVCLVVLSNILIEFCFLLLVLELILQIHSDFLQFVYGSSCWHVLSHCLLLQLWLDHLVLIILISFFLYDFLLEVDPLA